MTGENRKPFGLRSCSGKEAVSATPESLPPTEVWVCSMAFQPFECERVDKMRSELNVDVNGNGLIDDVSEMFGGPGPNGGRTGVAELATHDSNGDGRIDAGDAIWSSLRVWQDVAHKVRIQHGNDNSRLFIGVAA